MAPENPGDPEAPGGTGGDPRRAGNGPTRQWRVPDPGAPPQARRPATPATPARAPTTPTPPGRPPQQPGARPRPPQRPRRRRRIAFAVIGGLALVLAVYFLWLWTSYRGIQRVDLEGVLDEPAGDSLNYLLVGSDSRENLDPEAPEGTEPTVAGRRADTIILLRVGPDGSVMMSIPRDLWVTNPATGSEGRINGTYNDGSANLVRAVQENLDVPVNHYMEVDFASFAGLIDAVGGITIDFAHPAFDPGSGLDVQTSGPVTLDGTQALAYVRARNYTEIIDGEQVKDPTADLGRQERQREFLVTALSEVGSERNPIALGRAAAAMSGGLTADTQFGFTDALGLARRLGGTTPETVVLPTTGARIGGASVLVLLETEAQPVLDEFR